MELMKIFKCSICNRLPYGAVYTCYSKHPICARCRPTIRYCNRIHCKKEFEPYRNRELEVQINTERFECQYRMYGCQKMIKLRSYERHILICEFRPYCCPGCKLYVPVQPTESRDVQVKMDVELAIAISEDEKRKISIQNYLMLNDPWLCWGAPETLQGISQDETVAMEAPNLGRPTVSLASLFREGNVYSTMFSKRRKRQVQFF